MDLFTKKNCQRCGWVKKNCDLSNVTIYELNKTDYDALGLLAFHEGVELANTTLPILVLNDGTKVTGGVNIRKVLGRKDESSD